MKSLLLAFFVSTVMMASTQASTASPIGLWLAKDGAKIRISPCGQYLCGFIAQTNSPRDAATGGVVRDSKNADPAKRNRPLLGVQTLIAMKPSGSSTWSGQLYNEDDGRTYSGNLIEQSPSSIKIEGCWLGLCGGENLTRLK